MINRKIKELVIEKALLASALITILTTIGIIWVLLSESFTFFMEVSVWDFLTDTQWTPLFAQKHYGILSLISGTFLTTSIAVLVAVPAGLTIAVYLNEYASKTMRNIVKPMLEVLAAIPTVIYGFFALIIVTPVLQYFFSGISGFNLSDDGKRNFPSGFLLIISTKSATVLLPKDIFLLRYTM